MIRNIIVLVLLGVVLGACDSVTPKNNEPVPYSDLLGNWRSHYTNSQNVTQTFIWTFSENSYSENRRTEYSTYDRQQTNIGSLNYSEGIVTLEKTQLRFNEDECTVRTSIHRNAGLGYTWDVEPDTLYNWNEIEEELIELDLSYAENRNDSISREEAENIIDDYHNQQFTYVIEDETLTVYEGENTYELTSFEDTDL